jgi:hypothetical protein
MGMYCLALLLTPAPFTTIFGLHGTHGIPSATHATVLTAKLLGGSYPENTGHPKHFLSSKEARCWVSVSDK